MICYDFYVDLEGIETGFYKAYLVVPFQVQKNAVDQSCLQGNFHLRSGNVCYCAIAYIIKFFGTIRRPSNFFGP